MMRVCIARAQLQRALKLIFRRSPAPLMGKHKREGGVSLAGCGIDLNGLKGRSFCSGQCFRRRCKAVPCKSTVTIGQARVGGAIVRLLNYGLLKIIGSLPDSIGRSFVSIRAAL